MDENNQKIKGNKNVQVGVNNGNIINVNNYQQKVEVLYDSVDHITDSQAKEISDKIKEIARARAHESENPSKFYASEWSFFKSEFKITSYKLLHKDKYDSAIKWLQKREAYVARPKIRKTDNDLWKKKTYKGIFARSRQLGMDNNDIYSFAYDSLNLKKPITSLKELSDTRLKKLYQKIFSKRLK